MLYVDIPTQREFSSLAGVRADACVSIYLPTTPLTPDTDASRIELSNFTREARDQLQAVNFDKRRLAALLEELEGLNDDDDFWRCQAHSLAILATPDTLRTYRLANRLTAMVQVSDRFHLKPLLRAITFPHTAFILALSENAVRLVEMDADLPPETIRTPDLPKDAASAAGKSTLNDRSHSRRIHGTEGQNVRLQQYARKVDAGLRLVLSGKETPLILAATGRLASLFRQVNSYPYLLPDGVNDSPDRMTDAELAALARPVLDAAYAKDLADIHALFERRAGEGRTLTDVADAARAATFGAIDTMLTDIDSVIPGFVDEENGAVTFVETDDAKAYGVVDEIAARAMANGARVLGVRRADIPGGGDLAAILRYTL